MFKKFTKTFIISLASISLLGSGIMISPVPVNAATVKQNSILKQQPVFNIFSEVADILGVDEQTIYNKMGSGSTLAEIAESYNFSESALLDELKDRAEEYINAALSDGTMTQTQASSMKNYLKSMLKVLVESKYVSSGNLLSAPENFTATSKNTTSITLNWSVVTKATSYTIYRATSTYGPYTKLASVKTTTYTNKNLKKGITYYYKVKAVNRTGLSAYSSVIKAAAGKNSSSLSIPGSLTAKADSETQISLKWSSVTNATYYYIFRADSSSGTYSKIASSFVPNYKDKNLKEDTTYYYKIKAVNKSAQSEYSAVAKATTKKAEIDLKAPVNLIAESEEDDEITLEWDKVDDADSYYIYRATSSSGNYTLINKVDDTSYTDKNLSEDKTYYYKVKAADGSVTSAYSSIAHATTGDGSDNDLDAPDDLDITDVTEDTITLEWEEVDDADYYYVYRATSKSGTYTKIDKVEDNEFTDYDLESDKTYYYKVKAYDGSKSSDYSAVVYDTTDSGSDLDAPEDLDVTDVTEDSITLEWDEVEDADYYYVFRATSKSGSYSKIAKVKDTEYTNKNLQDDKTYYYKVKAYDGNKSSDYSDIVSGTTDED